MSEEPTPILPTNPPAYVPGKGGWTPPAWVPPVVGACIGGGLTSVGTVLASLNPGDGLDVRHLVGAFLVGCGAGVVGYLGIKSAGVRKL